MPAILVTGGAGYIGSHVCKVLHAAGHIPVVLDNLSRGYRRAVQWGPLIEGDIGNSEDVRRAINVENVAAVMHIAAFAYVEESMEDPSMYWRNNVVGSQVLLETMRQEGLKNIIFSSTCSTYGLPDQQPVTESTPQVPINTYGMTKLTMEHMISDFGRSYGFKSAILRYFNAAGADPDGEIGEAHDPEPHLIPNVIAAALGQKVNLSIHGDDYETRDGTCVRDYVHVSDIAEAHVLALRHLLDGGDSFICNLGSSQGHSVMEVVKETERVTGQKVPYEITPRRPGDPATLTADSSYAEKLLGWEKRHSDLETIITHAWKWAKNIN